MSTRLDDRQVRALESAIAGLKGVRQARVRIEEGGATSATVLVVPERDRAGLLEEIQGLAGVLLGEPLAADRVQVLSSGDRHDDSRRKLASVTTERSFRGFTARVTLELAGDILSGERVAPVGRDFERRCVAEATVAGVEELLDFPVGVRSIHLLTDAEERVVVVFLTRGSEILIGSAVVRVDEFDAVARATLDGINRFLVPGSSPVRMVKVES